MDGLDSAHRPLVCNLWYNYLKKWAKILAQVNKAVNKAITALSIFAELRKGCGKKALGVVVIILYSF